MNNQSSAWNRLVASARASRAACPPPEESAPYGFATRVVAQWTALRESERRLALWQRLSWRGAVAALLLCGVVVVSQRNRPADGVLIEAPSIPLPGAAQ